MDHPDLPQEFMKALADLATERHSDVNEVSQSLGTIHGERAAFTYLACMEAVDTMNLMATMAAPAAPPLAMLLMAKRAAETIAAIQVAGLQGYEKQVANEIRKTIEGQLKKRTKKTHALLNILVKHNHDKGQEDE